MPVRRYSERRDRGYGNFAVDFTDGSLDEIEVDLNFFFSFEILPWLPLTDPLTLTPYSHHIVQVIWRWQHTVFDVNQDLLQIYDNRTGKSKIGTIIHKAFGYVVDEEYWSYFDQIGDIYSTRLLITDGEYDNEIPCNQPPSATFSPPIADSFWRKYGDSAYFTFAQLGAGIIGNPKISDRFDMFLSPAIINWQLGILYEYTVESYTDDEWESLNEPVITVL